MPIVAGGDLIALLEAMVVEIDMAVVATIAALIWAFSSSYSHAWDGLYFGLNGGYGVAKLNRKQSDFSWYGASYSYVGPYTYSGSYEAASYAGTSIIPFGASGASAGGQIGYLFSAPDRFVFGPEVSVNWTNIGTESSREAERKSIFGYDGSSTNSGLKWLGVGLMRVGYDMGYFFPYAGVGLSFGQASYSNNEMYVTGAWIRDWNGSNYWNGYYTGSSYSGSKISTGIAAAAGVEAKITDHLSVKGEYQYSEIGGPRIYGGTICSYCYASNSYFWPSHTTDRIAAHQVRAGLNYHISDIAIKNPAEITNTKWTGVYIGAHGGYGGGQSRALAGGESNTFGGALAGGQIGANYEFANKIVVGAEVSGSWANLRYGSKNVTDYASSSYSRYSSGFYEYVWGYRSYYSENYSNAQEVRWMGLALLKAGYSFEKFLPYLQGGAMSTALYDSGSQTYSAFWQYGGFNNAPGWYTPYSSNGGHNTIVIGGALGAGLEYKVSDVLTFKTDYIYLNSARVNSYGDWEAYYRLGSHQVRGGFNLYVWTP